MARTNIDAVVVQQVATAYDETNSADYQPLGSGTPNGVEFTLNSKHLIILKATTGAAFTVFSNQSQQFVNSPLTIPDLTVNVGAGERFLLFPTQIYAQSVESLVQIDSDQADSEILILQFKGG